VKKLSIISVLASQGVLVALALLILFGWLRYDNFLGLFNISTVLRYNSMFALVSLGMCFVIMTGGIDLSVGGTAALGSVVAAYLSPYYGSIPVGTLVGRVFPGLIPAAFAIPIPGEILGTLGGVGAGLCIGLINGFVIVRLRILPFIATLAAMLAAYGAGLLLAKDQSISVSYESGFTDLGQGDLFNTNIPIPALIALALYVAGSIVLNFTSAGRTVLAIGGNEDASRLMGLPVDRVKFLVYVASGALAGLAGVILASQFGAGQPIEGVGWELSAIASVVVGGTLLTGGLGSVGATLAGVMLLGLVFNVLNFENGMGWISLSAYWQSVIRGGFLLVVVILQSQLSGRAERTEGAH
jgi:ribose transport system permease protein